MHIEENQKKCIVFSLKPKYYNQIISGEKTVEYRKGVFMKEEFDAFVYCTVPRKEIGLFLEMDKPVLGDPEQIAKVGTSPDNYNEMLNWLKGAKTASAIKVKKVKTFKPIALEKIREEFPDFHPPQRFKYIDRTSDLFKYLITNAGM